MKILLITGNDKLSGEALKNVAPLNQHVMVAVDCSTSIWRVLRLLWKKKLSCFLFLKMAWCTFFRKGKKPSSRLAKIESNRDLQAFFSSNKIDCVFLFHAGLIINDETIKTDIPLFNIHCAKIPEYAGLGAIWNAMRDEAFEQQATLHKITTMIDNGEIFDSEPYRLDPSKSYCENENIAYQAGIRLLKRTLDQVVSE